MKIKPISEQVISTRISSLWYFVFQFQSVSRVVYNDFTKRFGWIGEHNAVLVFNRKLSIKVYAVARIVGLYKKRFSLYKKAKYHNRPGLRCKSAGSILVHK